MTYIGHFKGLSVKKGIQCAFESLSLITFAQL